MQWSYFIKLWTHSRSKPSRSPVQTIPCQLQSQRARFQNLMILKSTKKKERDLGPHRIKTTSQQSSDDSEAILICKQCDTALINPTCTQGWRTCIYHFHAVLILPCPTCIHTHSHIHTTNTHIHLNKNTQTQDLLLSSSLWQIHSLWQTHTSWKRQRRFVLTDVCLYICNIPCKPTN